ncbi:MAG: 4Fe-4S dicluster domain-containing protein [Candidatus Binatia bacterium]
MSEAHGSSAPAPAGKPLFDRRGFLRRLACSAAKVGVTAGVLEGFNGLRRSQAMPAGARGSLGIVRPPGALEEPDFLSYCLRCTRCADACEAQCIRLFGPDAGDLHATPYVMPADKGCTMCLACGTACPTAALKPLTAKAEADMGVAVVDKRLCVSHNGTGVCGACHTACPLRNRAITQGIRNAPEVHADHCTGCGLCEEVCIVRDPRAIRVMTKRVLDAGHGAEGRT